jgi:hypothetical protein
MSLIGGTTAAGLGLAGSIVASSRPEAAIDQTKAAAADQNALADQDLLSEAVDDVADPQMGSDRDADGRLLYRRPGQPPAQANSDSSPGQEATPRPTDAFGDRGNALDLEA